MVLCGDGGGVRVIRLGGWLISKFLGVVLYLLWFVAQHKFWEVGSRWWEAAAGGGW